MSTPKVTEITIEQALHGYSQGHRLLEASCSLSIASQRALLTLSDFSGDLTEGFDDYLTGYPVPDSQYYAFARTWYAPEMDRPGSAWTHSLLIPRTGLQLVTNLHSLTSLFRKPDKGRATTTYGQSILYEIVPGENKVFILPYTDSEQDHFWRTLYGLVFKSLYENSENLVLLAQNSLAYEQFVLSVWSQQWPSLRANFTFSTGSLEPRNLANRPFDLQVAPVRNHSFFASRESNLVVVDPSLVKVDETPTPPNYRKFFQKFDPQKRFVWYYGSKMKGKRDNFGWLARLFTLTEEVKYKPENIFKVTEFLAGRFPEPQDMPDLKGSLFGGKGSDRVVIGALGEEEVLLKELVETPHGGIFDFNSLNIADRTVALCNSSPTAAREIAKFYVDTLEMNPVRSQFFSSLANSLTPEQTYVLLGENRQLGLFLWTLNPNLVACKEIWRSHRETSDAALAFLRNVSINTAQENIQPLDWQLIVDSIVAEDSEWYVDELDKIIGEQLPGLILNSHSKLLGDERIGDAWIRYLTRRSSSTLLWVSQKSDFPRTKALVATLLSSDSHEVMRHGSEPWLDLSAQAADIIAEPELTSVMGFLLSLGFRNVDNNAPLLVIDSFQVVYDAAASDSLPINTWLQLESLAPSHAFFFEWDKCRRLEEALISRTLMYSWESAVVVKASKTPGTLWRVLYRAAGSYEKKAIFQSIRQGFESGSLQVSPEQREVLESYFS